MFRKVLVANRGEIAVRVLRACTELGISTVAIFSEVDRNALHVRYADEAYPVGGAHARDSYLRMDRIIQVARDAGAEAIHPGYGFLAENAEFAQACVGAGLVFVGPRPETIRTLGNKLTARRLMVNSDIPVVPGSYEAIRDEAHAMLVGEEVGYPVLLKAAAGGGGKGMRVVQSSAEMPSALRAASSEALSAFGDGTVYVEKLLEGVRHIEFQLLADNFGNVVHLGERECSIQRRHQKLIEESPSTALDHTLRQQMGKVAVRAAQAAGYQSAGTVEFLLDRDKRFYFLEVNTRLQVEHPVTEMVTGVDVVIEQLRMAAGRKLRLRQESIRPHGWAIECRISAEDPYNSFLPSIGRITGVYEPSGAGVRVDSGVYEGFEVSLYYDPLIAKLVVFGETRGQAIRRMRRALSEYKIMGIKTSIPFHLRVMDTASFIGGRFDTAFLERQSGLPSPQSDERARIAALASAALAYKNRQSSLTKTTVDGDEDQDLSLWKVASRRESMRMSR